MSNWMVSIACLGLAVALTGCSREAGAPAAVVAQAAPTVAGDPAAQTDWPAMQDFWKRSMALSGIETGPAHASKRMVVYFDANCPVCARQWKILRPYLGTVRIHWVPIAYMGDSSRQRAAAILAAADPAGALADNENGFDFATDKGGYPLSADVPDWALRIVDANTSSAVRKQYVPGTPTLGFELYPEQRYFRLFGLLDESSSRVAVAELGNTMDPWHHPR